MEQGAQDQQMAALGQLVQHLQQQVAALQNQLAAQHGAAQQLAGAPKPAKPEFFHGTGDATRVRQWTFEVDTYFAAAGTPTAARVPFAATLLRGSALLWWQSLGEAQRPGDWETFKQALIAYHQPQGATAAARDSLARLTQRASVAQYAKTFRELALNVPDITDAEKLDRFKRGLKTDVRLHVALANPGTFEAAVAIANQVDDILFSNRRGYRENAHATQPPQRSQPTPMELGSLERRRLTDQQREELRRKGCCFYCREPGHVAAQCPKKTTNMPGNGQPRR
jgi:hypothetical protein